MLVRTPPPYHSASVLFVSSRFLSFFHLLLPCLTPPFFLSPFLCSPTSPLPSRCWGRWAIGSWRITVDWLCSAPWKLAWASRYLGTPSSRQTEQPWCCTLAALRTKVWQLYPPPPHPPPPCVIAPIPPGTPLKLSEKAWLSPSQTACWIPVRSPPPLDYEKGQLCFVCFIVKVGRFWGSCSDWLDQVTFL